MRGRRHGFIAETLRKYCGVEVRTVDIDAELGPDVVGSVHKLPLCDDAFEAAVCCEVLEHIPFEHFGEAVRELGRVARQWVVLSLPDVRRHYGVHFLVPKLRWLKLDVSIPRYGIGEFMRPGEHFWEIGYRGTPYRRVRKEIEKSGLGIERCFRLSSSSWHTFFLLRRKT